MNRELQLNASEGKLANGSMVNQGTTPLPKRRVLGVDISIGSFLEHLERFVAFARERKSSYVCCANAHMTVEASRHTDFARVVNEADFATCDGMPLTKALKWLAKVSQERVAGNDLLPAMLKEADREKLSVYFYGGTEDVLAKIRQRVEQDYPKLQIAGMESPPFGTLTDEELTETANRINQSGAQFVFVSLGCPKQERWMKAMRGTVSALMIGVGGAFLLYAGVDTRAPKWMRDLCLEWLYRLALEPRRLWKRYLVTNSIFAWMLIRELIRK